VIYRDVAAGGGWPAVPAGPKLEPGMRDARIAAVQARLKASGDLAGTDSASDLYDASLRHAIERFQSHHGLTADGIIGAGTIEALNVPVEARLATMMANLPPPAAAGPRVGRVLHRRDIAAASYRLVDDGETVFEQVAIVGQPDWQTPEVDSRSSGSSSIPTGPCRNASPAWRCSRPRERPGLSRQAQHAAGRWFLSPGSGDDTPWQGQVPVPESLRRIPA